MSIFLHRNPSDITSGREDGGIWLLTVLLMGTWVSTIISVRTIIWVINLTQHFYLLIGIFLMSGTKDQDMTNG